MLWLYQIPLWGLGLLVLSAVWVFTVGGVLIARPWVMSWHRSENETVGYMLSIAGVAYAVLLAMIAIGAWNASSAVDIAIQQEANALAGVYRGVDGFRPAARDHFQQLVRDYVDFVVRDEWPALARAARSPRTELASQTLSEEIVTYQAATPEEQALKPDVVEHVDQFEDARRLRLLEGARGLGPITWFVVIIGGIMTLAFTFFFRVEQRSVHVILSMLASGMLAVVVFLILAMDHPLWGEVSVQPDALKEVLETVTPHAAPRADTLLSVPLAAAPAKD
ncbi:MAG TPA: hypothetical protein VGM67_19785 [Gemmatimonadaceae bacterium]|jgi:hypothetical protein